MTDETSNGAPTPAPEATKTEQSGVRLQILTQYTRDLSFENAVAQKGLPWARFSLKSACRSALMPASARPNTSMR